MKPARRARLAIAAATLTGCLPGYVAPAPAPVRAETRVAAPFDSTWSAVVGYFAERNIEIKTIEKASGIIVAETARADNLKNRELLLSPKGRPMYENGARMVGPARFAECGTLGRVQLDPVTAAYNVRVTGDGTSAAFRVNARFSTRVTVQGVPTLTECASVGAWENDMEATLLKRLGQ